MMRWQRLGRMRKIAGVVVLLQLFILSYILLSMYLPRSLGFLALPSVATRSEDEALYLSPLGRLRLPNQTVELLSKVADKHGFVNIQFLSGSFVRFALSWICNVRRLEGDVLMQTVFFATDQRSMEELMAFDRTLQVVLQQHDQGHPLRYGQESYFALMLWRTEIIMELLELGFTFMLTEADAVWLKNPFEMMRVPNVEYDIMVMDDRMTHDVRQKMPNGGFIYFQATERTRMAWRDVLLRQRREMTVFAMRKKGVKKHFRNEQVFEAKVFKRRSRHGWLKLSWLPMTHYYSGMFYTVAGMNLTAPGHEPYVILNNFAPNEELKIARAKQHNHWFTQRVNGSVQCVYLAPRLVRLEKIFGTCRPEGASRIAYMDNVPPFQGAEPDGKGGEMLHVDTLRAVRSIADASGFVNVVFVHHEVTDAAFSWICNARRLPGNVLELTVFVAVDAQAHQALVGFDASLNVVFEPFSVLLQGKLLHSVGLWQYTRWRWKIVKELLDLHVSVLYTEVTSLWLKNPIPVIGIPRTPYDIVLFDKNMKRRQGWKVPSSSLMFLKSSDSTRAAWAELLQEQALKQSPIPNWDERLLKSVLNRLTPVGNVTTCWAPLDRFYSVTSGSLRAVPAAKKDEIVVVSNVLKDDDVNVYLAHRPGYYMFDGKKCTRSSDNLVRKIAGAKNKPAQSLPRWAGFKWWGR